MTALRRFGRDLLQGFFPELCLHCGEKIVDRDFFCTACAPRSGFDVIPAENPKYRQHYTFVYEGPLQTLFQAAKFSGRRRARRFFTEAAARDLDNLNDGKSVFLALPSRSDFLRTLLKKSLPATRLISDAFQVKRSLFGNKANKLLGEAGRYRRIHESLLWAGAALPEAERYILCDDVSTTGATLGHAAHLLSKNAGVDASRILLWSLMYRPRILKNFAV